MSPIRIRGAHWPRGCSGRRPLAGSPRPGLPLAAPRVPARDWPCPGGSRPDSARPRGAERRFQHRGRRTAIGTGTGPGAGPGTGSGDRTGTWRGSRDRDREQGTGAGGRGQGPGTGIRTRDRGPGPAARAEPPLPGAAAPRPPCGRAAPPAPRVPPVCSPRRRARGAHGQGGGSRFPARPGPGCWGDGHETRLDGRGPGGSQGRLCTRQTPPGRAVHKQLRAPPSATCPPGDGV